MAVRGQYLMDADIREATRAFDLHPVIERFGTWVVTLYGVESLMYPYFIGYDRVDEPDWESHMRAKSWCVMYDFSRALFCARKKASRPKARLRFKILRRDKYMCQLCGSTAASGAILEVDHKHAKSKGGSNDESNLWTLCEDCNRGKSDLEL